MIAMTSRARRGFSLIEILVAVLLIGVLMAVAAPRLLGSRDAAGDSAAQQQLNTVMLAASTIFSTKENFSGTSAADLQDDVKEVPLAVGGNPAGLFPETNVREVAITVSADNKTWTATALGGSGRCWYVRLSATNPDQYGVSTSKGADNTSCRPEDAPDSWESYGFPAAE